MLKSIYTDFLARKNNKIIFTRVDACACLLFFVLLGWYIYVAFVGLCPADESFYYTIPQRFFQGDRLLVDEWQLSQLSSLFQFLPIKLFTSITGGTDGIIVYMRFVTIVFTMFFYCFFYLKLRAYKTWGLLVTFLLCSFFPGGILAMSYYTITIFMLAVSCILLFLSKNELPLKSLFWIGIIFSCSVLAQPILVLVFVLYSGLCLLRCKSKTMLHSFDFVLNIRTWKGIALGCLFSFACFMTFIAIKSGIGNVVSNIPNLLGDAEYDLSVEGMRFRIIGYKFKDAMRFFGTPLCCTSIAVAILALFLKRIKRTSFIIKTTLFIIACLLLLSELICGICSFGKLVIGTDPSNFFIFCFYSNFPLTWFGLSCYGLCDKKHPRLFAFWLVGETASVVIAYASDAFLTLCGEVSNIATILLFGEVVGEIKDQIAGAASVRKQRKKSLTLQKKKKTAKQVFRAVRIAAAICVCAIVCWRSINFYIQGVHPYVETQASSFTDKRLCATIARGPHKGIRTTKELSKKYNDILEDLDQLVFDSKDQAVYIAGNCPFYYLYLDQPYATYSTWYVDSDSETRQSRYWELHSEKRPKYCYIPLYVDSLDFSKTWVTERDRMEKKILFFQQKAICNISTGKAGYLVEIIKWL